MGLIAAPGHWCVVVVVSAMDDPVHHWVLRRGMGQPTDKGGPEIDEVDLSVDLGQC
jgi:hypothetical protein